LGPRPRLNFIGGSGIKITALDDSIDSEIDLTIETFLLADERRLLEEIFLVLQDLPKALEDKFVQKGDQKMNFPAGSGVAPANILNGVTSAITTTVDTTVIPAQGAGVFIYVTNILVTNSHATVSTVVEIKNDGTTIHRGYAVAAGGGFALSFQVPLRLNGNAALVAANITTGSSTYVSAAGFRAWQ
jgi:hypothetical protein